jgi:hypothetical protein
MATARLLFLFLTTVLTSQAYSVLTHEAIIDSLWDVSLQKLLLKRFPGATPEDLALAHSYAYGGCIVQDMGYYPFNKKFFSDLTHYVRTGDFVTALVTESSDINEYAFALGALAHYAADNSGHRIGTNAAVPILYPELRQKFGKSVTYWDSPLSHVRTEFGFDVLQVAQGRYAPDSYHNFIGFRVSKPVLERAFHDTYGLEIKDVYGNLDLALGSFRYSVGRIIPEMTRVAWKLKGDTLIKETPGVTRKKFLYTLSRASYHKDWADSYQRPGVGTRFLEFLVRIMPKVGPFRSLAFRAPTPAVEKLFMASFLATVDSYKNFLAEVDTGRLHLVNENLDTGQPSSSVSYVGSDLAYDKLVNTLAAHHFSGLTTELKTDILAYYANRKEPTITPTKKHVRDEDHLAEHLEGLRSQPATPAPPAAAK